MFPRSQVRSDFHPRNTLHQESFQPWPSRPCIPSYHPTSPRKLTWQRKIHHEWRCISYRKWRFSNVMLVFGGVLHLENAAKGTKVVVRSGKTKAKRVLDVASFGCKVHMLPSSNIMWHHSNSSGLNSGNTPLKRRLNGNQWPRKFNTLERLNMNMV